MSDKHSASILFHADSWAVLNEIRYTERSTISRLVNEAVRFYASEQFGYTREEMRALGNALTEGKS
jgi:hypothetical protein